MVYFNGYQIRNHKTKQKFKTTNSKFIWSKLDENVWNISQVTWRKDYHSLDFTLELCE